MRASIPLGAASVRDKQPFQMLDDPLCGFAVPFGRNYAFFPLPRHQSRQRGRQLARIGPKEFVRPNRDGLGTFGVVAQGQAGHAQYGGLLARSDAPLLTLMTDRLSAYVLGELMRVRPRALWMLRDGGPGPRAACPQH